LRFSFFFRCCGLSLLCLVAQFLLPAAGDSLPRAFFCLLTKETKTAGGLFIGLIF
jgi:hypothetical protein